MESEKWQKAKELYEAALKQHPDERIGFLDENCGGDEELRREVQSLLSFSDDAEDFLEKPAVGEVAEIIITRRENLLTGQSLNHYKIIGLLGSGGMGEVYLAQDTELGRKVALKLLPAEFVADKDRARRFKQEARAASALNHPNILIIHEIGETENKTLFITTEYIEGETLRERLNGEELNLSETLDIAVQLAGALTSAHEAGIIHRDIKPENIMIRPDGYVKVLDFGLAKLLENQFQINRETFTLANQNTAPGIIMGTVRYMSPEQARGKEVDEQTDIFSFGVVLYEMIAGRPPFDGESNMDAAAAILEKEPTPVTQFKPGVPNQLQRIIGKTLRKNKDERYQTMHDVLTDLKDVRDELQIQAKLEHSSKTGLISQTAPDTAAIVKNPKEESDSSNSSPVSAVSTAALNSRESKRRKFKMLAVLVSGLIILSGAGIWFFGIRQKFSININLQKVAQFTIWSGLDDFPAMSPDGSAVAYCSDHSGTFEIYVKALTPGAKEIQLTNDKSQNFEPAWSHDGKYIAYYSKLHGGIWIIPSTGGEPKQLTDFGSHPAWSPDNTQIVFQSNALADLGAFARNALPPSTLWVVSTKSGESPRQLTQIGSPPGGHGSPDWSPDGKRITFEANVFNSSSIWTVSVDGSDARPVLPERDPPFLGYAPVYAPDGQSIFYHADYVFQVHINPATGESINEPVQVPGIAPSPSTVRRISFSADGKKIAYNVLNRIENISSVFLRIGTGEAEAAPEVIVSNATGRNNFPAFSPDGSRIAFSSCAVGGAGCDVWLANADGSNQTQLTTTESNELMPDWFPDGEQVAYISNRRGQRDYWAINLNTRRERMLVDLKASIDYIKLSPDGKKVIFNRTKDGVINVWTASLDDGEPRQLTFDKELMGFPSWSPDGKFIAFQVKRGDDTHVIIMPSEGGTPEQLTFEKGESWVYDWSPDGDKILFAGFRNGYWNVWWVSRSTKKEQQLTDYKKLSSFVRYPSWSPKGNQVAYEYSETTGNIWVAELK